jgi:O-antigen/teichoic acid export membrane protein
MSRSAVREVSRGSFYLGLEQLTMIVGGVFYSIVVLRMLGPATYGILNLGQAAIGLAGVLTTNIETYLERFVGELDARGSRHALRPLVRKIVVTKCSLAIVAGLLVALLSDPIATAYGYRDLRRLLPALAPLVLLEGAGYALRVTLFGLQRFRSIWIVALCNNLLKLAIVIMLWRLHEGVVALVGGLVLVQFLTVIGLGILVLRFLPKGAGPSEEVPTHRKIWQYVFPLLGARAFFLSGQHLNRLILGALLPARELGIASFALLTIDRFISLAAAVPNSLLPALSRLRGEQRDDTIEQVVTEGYRLVAAIAVIVMAGTFCLSHEAVWITGGREFLGAILPLQILALTPLFRTMQQPLSMGLYTYEKTRTIFWLAGLKFVVEPLCYPLLIPRLGVAGVALASLLSSVAVFGPSLRIADRLFPRTIASRRRATLTAWSIGATVVVLGWALHDLTEPWPGLAARSVTFLGAVAGLVVIGRLVHGDDLRHLAEASRREGAVRILLPFARWLDRMQGRTLATERTDNSA